MLVNHMKEEKKALAIKREEDGTQRVVAFGTGKEAEAIIEKARDHNIEIVQDPDEVDRILKEEREGMRERVIPGKIYSLISEVVSFVTELNDAWVRKNFRTEASEMGESE